MHVVLALGGNVSILDKLKGKNKAIVTLWQRASAPHSKIVRVTKLELQHCTMIQWFKTNCDVQMNIVKTIFVSLTTPWGEMVKFGLSSFGIVASCFMQIILWFPKVFQMLLYFFLDMSRLPKILNN